MSNAKTTHTSSGDDSLWDHVQTDGEEVARCVWDGGAPGYSGSTRIYCYQDQFYVVNDGEFHGPYETKDAAETAFPVFGPVDENDEGDAAIVEVWDKQYGMLFQRK